MGEEFVKATDSNGNNVKFTPYLGNTYDVVGDCNSVPEGIFAFSTSTLNKPTGSYGVVLAIGYNPHWTSGSVWKFQVAFVTNGNVYKRYQVNNGTWSAWTAL